MKLLILTLLFTASCAFAQTGANLEAIKAAAEAGDPAAQDQLAAKFISRMDSKSAELWYRKAAAQGYAHAQGQLGHMLFMRSRLTIGLKPDAKAALESESVKWMTLAANQGDKQGQGDLAEVLLEGKLVKTDLIEAYKWGELSTHGGGVINIPGVHGRTVRDSAILKMTAEQLAEAKQRVAEFKPHQSSKAEQPKPAAKLFAIKLSGISGGPTKRFATIGNKTFAPGERGTVKIDDQPVSIKCLEITDKTATISIEGVEGTQTLTLN